MATKRDETTALPEGTVTLLLADLEGSVSLWERADTAMTAAMKRVDTLVDQLADRRRGARPAEQGEGDSFVLAFARASDAVACAIDLLRGFSEEEWPGGLDLRFRIGVHTGEVETRDGGRYVGPAINRCARLRNLARGGQGLVSGVTERLVADQLPDGVGLRDLGVHDLRGLSRPEQVFQLTHPALDDDIPPLPTTGRVRDRLPRELSSFVGRDGEVAALEEALNETQLLTLTGVGGAGKTRLALHLATLAQDHQPDGVWWVDLAKVRDQALVPAAVADVLGVREVPGRSLTDAIAEFLSERHATIVLDNCEHVIDSAADIAATILATAPDITLVATSRERLRIMGEVSWRVPPLAFPEQGQPLAADTLEDYGAVRLFVDRAQQVRPNFRLTDDVAADVAEICARLDGIPLAIELAAARTRMLTPRQIRDGLEDRFRLLSTDQRTSLARHRTLEASVAWSHELLEEPARILFARLSVFAGSFTLDAAEEVCAGEGIPAVNVLDQLSELVDRSLVTVVDHAAGMRYLMLETVREFAAARLEEAGESDVVAERQLDHAIGLGEELAGLVMGSPQWFERHDAELANLRAAMDRAEETSQPNKVLQLAVNVSGYWMARSHIDEAHRRVQRALEAGDVDPRLATRARCAVARAGIMDHAREWAVAWALEGLAEAREHGDDELLPHALATQAILAGFANLPQADDAIEEAVAACQPVSDPMSLSFALAGRWARKLHQGDITSAAATSKRRVDLHRDAGQTSFVSSAAGICAVPLIVTGDLDAADAMLDEAKACSAAVADPIFEELAQVLAAHVDVWRGDLTAAAEKLYPPIPPRAPAWMTVGLHQAGKAQLEYARGNLDVAVSAYEVGPQMPLSLGAALGVRAHVDALRHLGELEAASEALEDALAEVAGAWRGLLLEAKGRLLRDRGELGEAEDVHHEALVELLDGGARLPVPGTLDSLAALAVHAERGEEAARLFAAADGIRERLGSVVPPVEQPARADELAALSALLDPTTLNGAQAEGRALSLEEAAAYARRGRGERRRPSSGWGSLTPTELDVVRLVAEGLTNPEIAERLFVASSTIKSHVSSVFTKLGVRSRSQLASEAIRQGLESRSTSP